MSTRIWYNRTFSTASHYVEMIRNNSDNEKFEIYATHPKRHSLMLQVADYAELEPKLPKEEYARYCLDFCRKHQIDIFVPHFGLLEISRHADQFEEIGTKVMLGGDEALLNVVSDKGTLFEELKSVDGLILPDYFVVNTASQFEESYRELKEKGKKVCFKPVCGEGGAGFRIIDDQIKDVKCLFQSVTPHVHLEDVMRMLSSVDQFESLMVMELLNGYEYSVDCLGTGEQLLAVVPRKKVEGRVRALESNEALIELAHAIHKKLPLQYNFNIQFIYQGDTPKLLEINPRTSGGLYTSCLSGINYPYLAVKLLLGQEVVVPDPNLDILATHIEKEVLINQLL
ncbi:ATP-grasp domain-containing protein [Paenibacillus thiaminolyticus]|uniref:ATP-grasp domain-containing protein n=1 Tax=Paenibacillus thiaminolyticus TaxID=49283 RepID=UPI00232C93FD|nr:ATP-grasp domain-containing protein [Paenibacillus thiaminolyticus]WCF08363.1 ATP-grasp domain-containing protein [Paenibacillus thiaminolyticus]